MATYGVKFTNGDVVKVEAASTLHAKHHRKVSAKEKEKGCSVIESVYPIGRHWNERGESRFDENDHKNGDTT